MSGRVRRSLNLQAQDTRPDIFPVATNGNFPSTSNDGTLVYVENTAPWPPRQLVWRDRKGTKVETVGQVTHATTAFALSSDQHRLVLNQFPSPQLIVRDLVSGTEISPASISRQFGALWTPDGNALTFAGVRGGSYDLVVQSAKPNGQETVLWATDADEFPSDWSSDGDFLSIQWTAQRPPGICGTSKEKMTAKATNRFPSYNLNTSSATRNFLPMGTFSFSAQMSLAKVKST